MSVISPLLCLLFHVLVITAQHLVPLSVPEPDVTAPPQSQSTIKILVCGDSITQGREFDFTWRYRLWEWFHANAAVHLAPTLQYVGPYNGTLPSDKPLFGGQDDPDELSRTRGAYHPATDPAFIGKHFALYGRPAWQIVDVLRAQIEKYDADTVILHLGFNDLAWWSVPPAELVERMAWLVYNARLGRRNVGVLVADVSSRVLLEGRPDIEGLTREYNGLLAAKVEDWTTPESPVMLVRVSEEYDCHLDSCPAGFDGLHPNALGDYQIARAYSKVLHEQYHFGAAPLVVPAIHNIPGMRGRRSLNAPIWLFMSFAFLCLVVLIAQRRRRTRERGRSRETYGTRLL